MSTETLQYRAAHFLRTSSPHHRTRAWYLLIDELLQVEQETQRRLDRALMALEKYDLDLVEHIKAGGG